MTGQGRALSNSMPRFGILPGRNCALRPIFRPFYRLTGNLGEEKRRAQRIVFEGGVVKPLVEAARSKISSAAPPSPDPNLEAIEANALLGLIRIESGIVKRQQNLKDKITPPDKVLAPLLAYTTGGELDPRLAELANWTYSKGDGTEKWPAGWLSGGETLASDRPGYNRPIDLGLERFRKSALQSLAQSETRWKLIIEIANFLKNEYAPRERSLFQAAVNQGGIQQRDPLLVTPFKELSKANTALTEKLQNAKAAGLFKDGLVSLSAAYEQILKERSDQQGILKSMLDELLSETVSVETQGSQPTLLLKEIQDRLNAILKEIRVELKGLDLAELKTLDRAYLGDYAGQGPVSAYRFNLYSLSFGATQAKPQFERLIGSDWAGLKKVIEDVATARKEVGTYEGEFKKESQSVCDYWLAYAERHQINEFCTAYLKQAREAIAPVLRFPLVWPPEERALTSDELRAAGQLVATIHKDLRSETFKKIPVESRAPLEAFDKQLSLLDPVLRGLIAPNGNIAVCSISMSAKLAGGTQQGMREVRYELRAGTPVSGDHLNLGKQGRVPLGEARLLIDRLPIDEIFHFHRHDPGKHEVPSGPNWCALRLLIKTKETSAFAQDGINWEIRIDDAHPEVIVNFVFEYALPKLPNWPTRQSVLPSNPK